MVQKMERLLLLGFTDEQITTELGLKTNTTLRNWRKTIPAVAAVFASGRALAVGQVAQNLYKRANGFRVKTEKIFHHPDTGIVRAKTSEYYPPDVRAAELILRSRRPQEWPSPNSVNVGVQVVAGIPPETLEGLQKLARITAGFDVPQAQNTPTIESSPANQSLPTVKHGAKSNSPNPPLTVTCAIDTPSGSVPEQALETQDIQELQPTEPDGDGEQTN
jgi:hypothetical protein